jgi:hypothetical protein
MQRKPQQYQQNQKTQQKKKKKKQHQLKPGTMLSEMLLKKEPMAFKTRRRRAEQTKAQKMADAHEKESISLPVAATVPPPSAVPSPPDHRRGVSASSAKEQPQPATAKLGKQKSMLQKPVLETKKQVAAKEKTAALEQKTAEPVKEKKASNRYRAEPQLVLGKSEYLTTLGTDFESRLPTRPVGGKSKGGEGRSNAHGATHRIHHRPAGSRRFYARDVQHSFDRSALKGGRGDRKQQQQRRKSEKKKDGEGGENPEKKEHSLVLLKKRTINIGEETIKASRLVTVAVYERVAIVPTVVIGVCEGNQQQSAGRFDLELSLPDMIAVANRCGFAPCSDEWCEHLISSLVFRQGHLAVGQAELLELFDCEVTLEGDPTRQLYRVRGYRACQSDDGSGRSGDVTIVASAAVSDSTDQTARARHRRARFDGGDDERSFELKLDDERSFELKLLASEVAALSEELGYDEPESFVPDEGWCRLFVKEKRLLLLAMARDRLMQDPASNPNRKRPKTPPPRRQTVAAQAIAQQRRKEQQLAVAAVFAQSKRVAAEGCKRVCQRLVDLKLGREVASEYLRAARTYDQEEMVAAGEGAVGTGGGGAGGGAGGSALILGMGAGMGAGAVAKEAAKDRAADPKRKENRKYREAAKESTAALVAKIREENESQVAAHSLVRMMLDEEIAELVEELQGVQQKKGEKTRAATSIQAASRMKNERDKFRSMVVVATSAARKLQCRFRGRLARKKFRSRKVGQMREKQRKAEAEEWRLAEEAVSTVACAVGAAPSPRGAGGGRGGERRRRGSVAVAAAANDLYNETMDLDEHGRPTLASLKAEEARAVKVRGEKLALQLKTVLQIFEGRGAELRLRRPYKLPRGVLATMLENVAVVMNFGREIKLVERVLTYLRQSWAQRDAEATHNTLARDAELVKIYGKRASIVGDLAAASAGGTSQRELTAAAAAAAVNGTGSDLDQEEVSWRELKAALVLILPQANRDAENRENAQRAELPVYGEQVGRWMVKKSAQLRKACREKMAVAERARDTAQVQATHVMAAGTRQGWAQAQLEEARGFWRAELVRQQEIKRAADEEACKALSQRAEEGFLGLLDAVETCGFDLDRVFKVLYGTGPPRGDKIILGIEALFNNHAAAEQRACTDRMHYDLYTLRQEFTDELEGIEMRCALFKLDIAHKNLPGQGTAVQQQLLRTAIDLHADGTLPAGVERRVLNHVVPLLLTVASPADKVALCERLLFCFVGQEEETTIVRVLESCFNMVGEPDSGAEEMVERMAAPLEPSAVRQQHRHRHWKRQQQLQPEVAPPSSEKVAVSALELVLELLYGGEAVRLLQLLVGLGRASSASTALIFDALRPHAQPMDMRSKSTRRTSDDLAALRSSGASGATPARQQASEARVRRIAPRASSAPDSAHTSVHRLAMTLLLNPGVSDELRGADFRMKPVRENKRFWSAYGGLFGPSAARLEAELMQEAEYIEEESVEWGKEQRDRRKASVETHMQDNEQRVAEEETKQKIKHRATVQGKNLLGLMGSADADAEDNRRRATAQGQQLLGLMGGAAVQHTQSERKVGFAMDGDGKEGGEEGGDATESAARIRARQPTTFVRKGDEADGAMAAARVAAAQAAASNPKVGALAQKEEAAAILMQKVQRGGIARDLLAKKFEEQGMMKAMPGTVQNGDGWYAIPATNPGFDSQEGMVVELKKGEAGEFKCTRGPMSKREYKDLKNQERKEKAQSAEEAQAARVADAETSEQRRKVGFAMDGDGEEGGEEGGDATESAARIRARQPTTFVRKGDEMSSTFAEARAAAATVPGKSVEQQQMTQSAPQA